MNQIFSPTCFSLNFGAWWCLFISESSWVTKGVYVCKWVVADKPATRGFRWLSFTPYFVMDSCWGALILCCRPMIKIFLVCMKLFSMLTFHSGSQEVIDPNLRHYLTLSQSFQPHQRASCYPIGELGRRSTAQPHLSPLSHLSIEKVHASLFLWPCDKISGASSPCWDMYVNLCYLWWDA